MGLSDSNFPLTFFTITWRYSVIINAIVATVEPVGNNSWPVTETPLSNVSVFTQNLEENPISFGTCVRHAYSIYSQKVSWKRGSFISCDASSCRCAIGAVG